MIFTIIAAIVLLGTIVIKTDALTNVFFDSIQAVIDTVEKHTSK